MRPNISLGDTLAGLHAAFGTVMALLHRSRDQGGKVMRARGRGGCVCRGMPAAGVGQGESQGGCVGPARRAESVPL